MRSNFVSAFANETVYELKIKQLLVIFCDIVLLKMSKKILCLERKSYLLKTFILRPLIKRSCRYADDVKESIYAN